MPSSFPFIPGVILIVILAGGLIALAVWVLRLAQSLTKVTNALVDEKHKVAEINRILSKGMPHQQAPAARPQAGPAPVGQQKMQRSGSQIPLAQASGAYPEARSPQLGNIHPVDAFMSERNREESQSDRRGRRGRRDKPVIPFGVDRTNRERAAQQAAAYIDAAPNLSMDLSEPARQQMMAAHQQRGPRPNVPNPQQRGTQMRQPAPMPRQGAQQAVQGRYASNATTQPNRNQQGPEQRRRQMPNREQLMRERQIQDRQEREKAAVSAQWLAEEERRLAEKKARQEAQARRAELRQQAQVRRQAEMIVQEHRRQTEGVRNNAARPSSADDTIRFDNI